MSLLARIIKREPVGLREAVDALIGAALAWAVGFEVVHWTAPQIGLVLGLYRSAMGVGAIVVRSLVTPNGTAAANAEEAAAHAEVAERDRVTSYLGVEAAKDREARRARRPVSAAGVAAPEPSGA